MVNFESTFENELVTFHVLCWQLCFALSGTWWREREVEVCSDFHLFY